MAPGLGAGSFLTQVKGALDRGWEFETTPKLRPIWAEARPTAHVIPRQGWKLHVSADILSAPETLRRVLPVLNDVREPFKVAFDTKTLAAINSGMGGLSQVGKFITVYPSSDSKAVEVGGLLDQATRGLSGPRVQTDARISPSSVVSYRFGAFGQQFIQDSLGQVTPALLGPDGLLIPDQHELEFRPPSWTVNPFARSSESGTCCARQSGTIIGRRYLLFSELHRSPRGSVHLGADLHLLKRCIIKSAGSGEMMDSAGWDASARLKREARTLQMLANDSRFPSVMGWVEEDNSSYLILEDMGGRSIGETLNEESTQGRLWDLQRVRKLGIRLADILSDLYEQGMIYRDLNARNVLVDSSGHVGLIDFEATAGLEDRDVPAIGSRGYSPPSASLDNTVHPADDVYSLGALLFYAYTGADPALAPDPGRLLSRPLSLFRSNDDPQLRAVIERSLQPRREDRYPSVVSLREALRRPAVIPNAAAIQTGISTIGIQGALASLADSLGAHLIKNTDFRVNPYINNGAAGTILGLAEIVAADLTGTDLAACVLHRSATRLASSGALSDLPGFYVGDAGIAAVLLRSGQVLHDAGLKTAARRRGRIVAAMPHTSPDIFAGTAGRLLMHLLLWDEFQDQAELSEARHCGNVLIARAEDVGRTGKLWTIPAGFRGLSGTAYLGYAHGAAGIADALLDLFEATGEDKYLETASSAVAWIANNAVHSDHSSQVLWPAFPGGAVNAPFWCHGGTGICRTMLHLRRITGAGGSDQLLESALNSVNSARWTGPTQCHGLAGSLELLLDASQLNEHIGQGSAVDELATLLLAHHVDDGWHAGFEDGMTESVGYLLGCAGFVSPLLRVMRPNVPRQMSRLGFRSSSIT